MAVKRTIRGLRNGVGYVLSVRLRFEALRA